MNTIRNIPATTQEVETAVEKAIDKLALMINEGFKTTATKDDLTAVEGRLTTRLDRIEHLLLAEQKREMEDLKKRMKPLEDALAVWQRSKSAASPHTEPPRLTSARLLCMQPPSAVVSTAAAAHGRISTIAQPRSYVF